MSLEICSNAGASLCLCLTEGREPEIPSCGHLLKLDVPWIDICRGNGTVCIFSVMIKEMAEVQWQFLPQQILVHVEIKDTGQQWVATQQMNYEHRMDWTGLDECCLLISCVLHLMNITMSMSSQSSQISVSMDSCMQLFWIAVGIVSVVPANLC